MGDIMRYRRASAAALSVAIGLLLALAGSASAKTQLNLSEHFGGEVNANGADTCMVSEACQAAREGAGAEWFTFPRSVAINQETQDVYVVDTTQRVQEFSASGAFIRAWGANVVSGAVSGTGNLTAGSSSVTSVSTTGGAFLKGQTVTGPGIPAGAVVLSVSSSALNLSKSANVSGTSVPLSVAEGTGNVPVNEQQRVTVKATEGAFSLTFTSPFPGATKTSTANLAYNATAAQVQSSLEGLANIGPGGVTVTGGPGDASGSTPYLVTFQGRNADTNVNQLVAKAAGLAGGLPSSTAAVATVRDGASVFEECTVESACQTGAAYPFAGALNGPLSLAVDNTCFEEKLSEPACKTLDPAHGTVYVQEAGFGNNRIDEFDATGKFIRMFGGEVNKTAVSESTTRSSEENVCPAVGHPSDECQYGRATKTYPNDINGYLSVAPAGGFGDLLAFGGPKHLLYVGMEGAVEAFDQSGQQESELTLLLQPSTSPAFPEKGVVTGLAVDRVGDVYVSESHRELEEMDNTAPKGAYEFAFDKLKNAYKEVAAFDTSAEDVAGIALDPHERVTVTEFVPTSLVLAPYQGVLFGSVGQEALGTFGLDSSSSLLGTSMAYNDTTGELYALRNPPVSFQHEVNVFTPVITPNVITVGVSGKTATSATLEGEVQANESSNLTATSFFEYGRCVPAPRTCAESVFGELIAASPATQTSETFEPTSAHPTNLWPNQRYHFRAAASNQDGTSTGTEKEFETPPLPPFIEAAPEVPFVHSESAVFSDTLNPENAATHYQFEYGACTAPPPPSCNECLQDKTCLEVGLSTVLSSALYAEVGDTQEITGLRPAWDYSVRLVAVNTYNERTVSSASEFTTGSPVTPRAVTGPYGAIGGTSATITGEVNPDGRPAVYAFELGVYEGASTQYATVLSASAGEGTNPAFEEMALTGLQPATTYAYRIAISSAFVKNEAHTLYGQTATFTTRGVPIALPLPEVALQLSMPPEMRFPSEATSKENTRKCKRGYKRNKRGRCVKVKPKKARKARSRRGHGRRHNKS